LGQLILKFLCWFFDWMTFPLVKDGYWFLHYYWVGVCKYL
jgi:hypothetical protein